MYTKSPENRNVYVKKRLYTCSARVAFDKILKLLSFSGDEEILLPSYIGYTDREGSGVFDPINSNLINFNFYELEKDLSIDFINLEERLSGKNVKALLIIHYFGFDTSDIFRVKELCERYNVYLIEDCAHSYFSKSKGFRLGDIGDFSFTSLHKIFPVNSGGALQINNIDFNISKIKLDVDECINVDELNTILSYDFESANKKIKDNFYYLNERISKISGITPIYSSLNDGVIPMNYPILVSNGLREKLYFNLISKNIIVTALYYRLINEIAKNKYPISLTISENILNLPINQDIEKNEIDEMINSITFFMAEYYD